DEPPIPLPASDHRARRRRSLHRPRLRGCFVLPARRPERARQQGQESWEGALQAPFEPGPGRVGALSKSPTASLERFSPPTFGVLDVEGRPYTENGRW